MVAVGINYIYNVKSTCKLYACILTLINKAAVEGIYLYYSLFGGS